MKQNYLIYSAIIFSGLIFQKDLSAQGTYISSNYAGTGDTVYLTKAQPGITNFDTIGTGLVLDYSGLTGVSQRRLIYKAPNQTGFSFAQWPYIYNASNVNLSSTDDKTYATASLQYTDPNDYFLKNTSYFEQKASSAKVTLGSATFNIKNVYSSPDVIVKFPLNYGNIDSSQASFTTSIPTIYYRNATIKRVNRVTAWGSVTTPNGTYANCLKLESTVREIDTIAVDTIGFPQDTLYYREIRWFDASKKYEILYVKETKVGNVYITQKVEYLDNKQFFQPLALFAYLPLLPEVNDTVNFQNLSTNGYSYYWDFDDPSSGVNNTSTLTNPSHIYNSPGIFQIKLIAFNGSLTDTVVIPVSVATIPSASFTYLPSGIFEGDSVFFTNTTINAATYKWIFGDPTSGIKDTSYLLNPKHVYVVAGTYSVMLIAYSSAGADTAYASLIVQPAVAISITENIPEDFSMIFPNPTNGKFTLNLGSLFSGKDCLFKIVNVLGQVVFMNQIAQQQTSVDIVDRVAKGIYFVQIMDKQNKIIETRKLVCDNE